MPLLDHFHPPLSERRQWHSFHSVWASMIALDLNRQLPPGYFADANVEFNIEIDARRRLGAPIGTKRRGAP